MDIHKLVLLLSTATVISSLYHAVVRGAIGERPSASYQVDSICTCRMTCDVQPTCKAASYVPSSSTYRLVEGKAGQMVRLQNDVVTFSKYQLAVRTFLTKEKTTNGVLAQQKILCAAEGGWLLEAIKTETEHDRAKALIAVNGSLSYGKKFAFVAAFSSQEDRGHFWSDGSAVAEAMFAPYGNSEIGGDTSVLGEDGKLVFVRAPGYYGYPVLCYDYLTVF